MIHRKTGSKVFDKLVASLESAERGSRELDIIVSFLLGDTSSDEGQLIQLLVGEGYPWAIISDLLDEDIPAYTASLDATLPGENIVLACWSARRAKWAAVHQKPDGKQIMAWAASECLARRLAALKAVYDPAQGMTVKTGVTPPATAARKTPPPTAPKPRMPKPAPWDTAAQSPADREGAHEESMEDEATEEWKILF